MKITAMSAMCGDIFMHSGEIRPGGEALNFAAIASEYDHMDVHLMGAVGDDACGEQILSSIAEKRIGKSCVHVIRGGTTACNKTYLTPDGDRYYKPDSWNGGVFASYRMVPEDLELIASSDLVYLHIGCPHLGQVMKMRREHGFQLAVDFDVARDLEKMERFAPEVDFFFSSGEESMLSVFCEWSKKYGGVFNLTLAAAGSVTYCGGREYRVKAVPVETVVDTTGCGDSYHAAFLCEYARSGDILAAMEEGSRVASRTLSHIGGFTY